MAVDREINLLNNYLICDWIVNGLHENLKAYSKRKLKSSRMGSFGIAT
jgi:hypothetical protein